MTPSPANRSRDLDVPDGLRVIVRSEPHDDLVVTMRAGAAVLALEPMSDTPAHLLFEPAARLLLLWGRREPSAPTFLDATGPERVLLERLVPVTG